MIKTVTVKCIALPGMYCSVRVFVSDDNTSCLCVDCENQGQAKCFECYKMIEEKINADRSLQVID